MPKKKKYQNTKKGYSELERLAYKIGLIENARKIDTRVKDSYENGLKGKQIRTKKPLC